MSLLRQTLLNISYNTLARIVAFAFQAVTNVVLSRNLGADDYGIVGFAMIFINFLWNFNDLGIKSAVIQKSELSDRALYTAYTLKFILGFAIFAATFAGAGLAPLFFDNRAVINVIRLLSLNFMINTFGFLSSSLLTRELNYKNLSLSETCVSVISSLVAMLMALKDFGYWSIVVANVASSTVSVFILNLLRPVRFRFCFDRTVAREFLKFGGNLFLAGIVAFAILNIDNFVVGAVAGSKSLGYYALAFNWGIILSTILNSVVISVLVPTFAKIQHERDKVRESYLKVLEYVAFAGILASTCIFAVSRDFLVVVLGGNSDKWLPALTAFRVLCLYGMARLVLEPVTLLVMALARTDIPLRANIVLALVQLGLLYPALLYFGINGVALVVALSFLIQYPIYFSFMSKELGMTVTELLVPVRPAFISAAAVMTLSLLFEHSLPIRLPFLIGKLLLAFLGFILVYGVVTRWKLLREMQELFTVKLIPGQGQARST